MSPIALSGIRLNSVTSVLLTRQPDDVLVAVADCRAGRADSPCRTAPKVGAGARPGSAVSTCCRTAPVTPSRFRFASTMSRAADDAGLPDDPDFRSAFMAYVEWGTRLAFGNSQV